MIRTSRPLRIALAGTTALVTISALVTTLVSSPANAAAADNIILTPSSQTGAAGTCLMYTVNVRDAVGGQATDTGTIEVTIQEDPESDAQDVDFCIPTGATNFTTPSVYPHYINVQVPAQSNPTTPGYDTRVCDEGDPFEQDFGCTQYYAPGPSITTVPADSPSSPPAGTADNPDGPGNTSPQTSGTPPRPAGNPDNNSNFTGKDYASFNYSGANPSVTFGVVGLVPGGATINAHHVGLDKDSNEATAEFRSGGRPRPLYFESTNAARSISVEPVDSVKPIASATHTFKVTVRNATGDTLLGVEPSFIVVSGPGTNTSPRNCPFTDNSGVSTCSYTSTSSGVDNLKFFVNQSTGSPTVGPDPTEPQTNATATTTAPPVGPQFAYTIDLTPDQATTPANGTRTFVAAVTAKSGAPAQGVPLSIVETGPGVIRGSTDSNGTSVTTGTTDATGRVSVIIDVPNGVSGTETITATINSPETTECGTAGGRCNDTSTNTISGSVSPSPSPSGTRSPTPTRTATPSGGRRTLSASTPTPDIEPTDDGVINASGEPNASVELRCYTRPDTNYFTARGPSNLSSSGALQFVIHPGANTRCYVRYAGDEATASNSVVINVHTTLSLSAYRDGVRRYHFQGTNLPRRAGQLITLYRWARRDTNGFCDPHIAAGDYTASSSDPNCVAVRTATATTNSTNVWRIDRTFTGSGQFVFQVRTSQTLNNAAGVSNPRLTIIH
jgi:hypothetical protein